MPVLTLHLMGVPILAVDGRPIEVDTRKASALLIYLALHPEPQPRETLLLLLWPDYDESSARAALRRTLSALRKAVGEGILLTNWSTVSLSGQASLELDVHQFRAALQTSAGHCPLPAVACPGCLVCLRQAVDLYRGDFLSGFGLRNSPNFDDWQTQQAEELRHQLAGALERLSHDLAVGQDFTQALHYNRRWISLDALNEAAHRQAMLSYAWSGQRTAALRQYRECVRLLDQHLGVPPLEETTHLYQQISELDTPRLPHVAPASLPTRPAGEPHPLFYPLVGRQIEMQQMLQAYQRNAPRGYVIALQGEAGIGKTRLAEDFLSSIGTARAVVLAGRCYEGETHLAYAPFVAMLAGALHQPSVRARLTQVPAPWLNEAARLLPDLSPGSVHLAMERPVAGDRAADGGPGPGSEGIAQSRFFEGLRQVLLHLVQGAAPGILFFDDLHWADAASLELLIYLARRLSGQPLLLLLTWRAAGLTEDHRLHQLLAELHRAQALLSLSLTRLSAPDVAELVRSVRVDLPTGLDARLYEESEGLPLFAVEYLQAIASAPADWSMPTNVRDLIHTRLAHLGETERQLLSTAAVIGRSFDLPTLLGASGRREAEAIPALENLLAQHLVNEQRPHEQSAEIRFDFTHDKIRSLVYEETSLTRLRLLHRRVADALLTQARQRREPALYAAQIGQHYRLAGLETQAAEAFKQAGDYARSLHAHVEALQHFQLALALGYPHPAWLHEVIGDLQIYLGDYLSARASYETAAAIVLAEQPYEASGLPAEIAAPDGEQPGNLQPALSPGPGEPPAAIAHLAQLEHKLGRLHHRRGDWELAMRHFEAALQGVDANRHPAHSARIYSDWSLAAHQAGLASQAARLADNALHDADLSQQPAALAQAHNLLGILARSRGDLDQARQHLQESLRFAELFNDPSAQIAALNNLSLLLHETGQIAPAIELAKTALEMCQTQGDRHREAALLNNLADLHHAAGQSEAALEYLTRAVVIYAEISVEAGALQPEIWKLVEW